MLSLFSFFLANIIVSNFIIPSLDQGGFFSTQERFIEKKIIPGFLFKPRGVSEFNLINLSQEKNNKKIGPMRFAVSSSSLPKIEAESIIVVDRKDKRTLFGKDINKVLPIASMSKLMTALVFLDTNPDWDSYYQITLEDRREGGKIYLYLGERVKIVDIFNTSLSASANSATIALVNSTGFSEDEFVKKMNKKAFDLGLFKTKFKDATGLSEENVSTSWEISKLASVAFLRDEIKRAISLKDYKFETEGGREKNIKSTDDLLSVFPLNNINLIGGKTGYNEKAGFCFVGIFQKNNNDLITVVMGAEEESARFNLAKKITLWVFNNYEW